MLEALGKGLTRLSRRYVPDPLVLAVLLTLLAFVLAFVHVGFDPERVLFSWFDGSGKGKGFWNLLAFGMQMCLILVTGHALASSPPVKRALDALADRASTPTRAIAIVAVGAMLLALVNWGLGLIAGALLARQVGQRARTRGVAVHYPLLAAAGYSGLLVWHGGLSGSAPLKVTLDKDLVEILGAKLASQVHAMPLSETIGSWPNVALNVALVIALPWVLIRMQPRDPADRVAAPAIDADAPPQGDAPADTPAARLERSRLLVFVMVALGAATWGLVVRRQGIGNLDPNLLNFLFLFLGLALHGSLASYGCAVVDATQGCAGIILQFPLYAGIMGLLTGTGLVGAIAASFSHAGSTLLPALSFYSAGLVNLFIPSGGGQWAVQGPVLMEAATRTGVAPARLVLALAYGDQWTNMLQPFWALPLLGITRVAARDIIGYTAVLLLVSQFAFIAALYVGW